MPQLSVAENIFAGRQPTKWLGQVDVRLMRDKARALIAQLGVEIDPALKVTALSPAQAQIVEIAKALSRDLRVLILDEPTAALTLTETEKLFEIVRRLAKDGVSIIYVSHRLAEIFALCHSVTVLKDGRLAGTRRVAETSTDELIRLMVGREVHLSRAGSTRKIGAAVLEAENIAAPPLVRSASITVRSGEIVCLAGLIGSGRSEFCEAIFGARAPARRHDPHRRQGDRSARPVGRQACRHRHGARGPEDVRPVPRHGPRQQHRRDGSFQGFLRRQFLQRQGRGAGEELRRRAPHRDAQRSPDRRRICPAATSRRCCWPSGSPWSRSC